MDIILQRMNLYFKKNPVTFVLLVLNTIMFFVVLFNGGFTTASLINNGGLLPRLVTDNKEYYRLLVSMFLHAGLLHFLMNSYFLYYLGSFTEKLLGSTRYAIIYMLSGLGASVAVWLFSDPDVVTIGASGALYGIMGGLLILTFLKANWFSPYGIRSIRMISIINIVFTLTLSGAVSVQGHLGGLVSGIILTYLFIPDLPNSKQRYQDHINPNNQVHNGKIIIDMDDVTDDDIYTN
ncbi:rhomboid family intramembrane serine protease [Mariniplasma anaerobium]|uniref:Rhomboid family intramembrane serine protease n=1 Tax=Mariniplasma anaerobium TaxID=2735436 RepID=A0A7U9XWV3_9MOLU|nr:rhomboid family intramembrane serine protease [Mariniplasma anaerobium]BCR36789.1 rhomboid family intramembrane serine protease [Mariniplasma anaerobium]